MNRILANTKKCDCGICHRCRIKNRKQRSRDAINYRYWNIDSDIYDQYFNKVDNYIDAVDHEYYSEFKPSDLTGASSLMALKDAPNKVRKQGWKRGIYVIFKRDIKSPKNTGKPVGRRVYVGSSTNLSIRLQQHLWCLTHFQINPSPYRVKVYHFKNANKKTLKERERQYRKLFPSKFKHQINTLDA